MAKGYWIAHVDVFDMERYKKYIEANAAAFAKYGGKFLVRGGDSENPEGETRARHVVLEFESFEQAKACYHSAEYQAAIPYRNKPDISVGDFVIVEGYDPA